MDKIHLVNLKIFGETVVKGVQNKIKKKIFLKIFKIFSEKENEMKDKLKVRTYL